MYSGHIPSCRRVDGGATVPYTVTVPCPAPDDPTAAAPDDGVEVVTPPDSVEAAALAEAEKRVPEIAPEMADEPALVDRIKRGDSAAYDTLVRRYLRRAYAVANRMVGNDADAEDVVQDAFLRALDKIEQCAPGRTFGPWFFRILITQALNHRRSRKVRTTEALLDTHHGDGESTDAMAERNELRGRFAEALAELPEVQQTIVQLSDVEGYGSTELATMLDMRAGTVRWHLHQARHSLRKSLKDFAPGARKDRGGVER